MYAEAYKYKEAYIYVCREGGVVLDLCIASMIIWSLTPKSQLLFISVISSLFFCQSEVEYRTSLF